MERRGHCRGDGGLVDQAEIRERAAQGGRRLRWRVERAL
jgi:hypothetical protein